ncbi:MAG: cell division protein ZapA [Firmicutes bacterium HGW-Firmicutes-12]|jgi:cell division protein ZapA|nr:MAG: cell division protein ZapA [Firmicutes bacterium HGW-Firmicutes-12]
MGVKEKDPKDIQCNRVNVRILNEEYTIRGNADIKHIEKVAAYVDSKMRFLTLKCPNLIPSKVAVLTAVNITYELFQLQKDYDELIKLLDEDKSI